MKLLTDQIEYERLLELKFKLKRKAHTDPLTPHEIEILGHLEEKLKINSSNAQYVLKIAKNPGFMCG